MKNKVRLFLIGIIVLLILSRLINVVKSLKKINDLDEEPVGI